MKQYWQREVNRFWFKELKPEQWFTADPEVDETIRERFEPLYEELKQDVPEKDQSTAGCCVAVILVLDQFPRNMYRDSAKSFATDSMALAVARHAILEGFDVALTPTERQFIYMPFQHSEDREVQELSVKLFSRLGNPEALAYAERHKAVIDAYGRFPHRNKALGRASTPAEKKHLKDHPFL